MTELNTAILPGRDSACRDIYGDVTGRPTTFTAQQLSAAVSQMRSYNAVAVVGAGLSAFGYPMTAQLPALLWQAIDDVEGAADELRSRSGQHGTPKAILGSAPATLKFGWELTRDLPAVRTAFQRAFVSLDANRQPSRAHRNLARLIHAGVLEYVVSFNWDTCLERAYNQLFGTSLRADDIVLSKPHGDAADPDSPWVLPDEDGVVPAAVLDRMRQLDDRPRTLIVIGYSGSDRHVVDVLLTPREQRWPVVRVSPSAAGEGAVPGPADTVTDALVDKLLTARTLTGWRYVTFNATRDISAALRGERLGPADVEACLELPAVGRLASRLRSAQFATLSGASGSGKSVTAFQAARHLNREGWSVVELVQPGVAAQEEVGEFLSLPGPVLAVVDDAQAIPRGVLTELERSASSDQAVLLVSTERLESRGDETLTAGRAVEALYTFCLENVDVVGPLVSQLDDRVAKSAFSETPEQRLALARRTSEVPWVFMFVLSGGERRINSALERLTEQRLPAVVLGLIAAGQMISQDAGVTRGELEAWLAQYDPSPGAVAGLDEALAVLAAERLLLDRHERIRTAHIRIADWALRELGRTAENEISQTLLAFVRAQLIDPVGSVRGKLWLLQTFDRSDTYRYRLRRMFLDDDAVETVVNQCLDAGPGPDRGTALYLVWDIDFMVGISRELAERVAARVGEWLPTMTTDEAFGFRWILSGLRARHKDLHAQVCQKLPAGDFARLVSQHGSRATAASWADLMGELAHAAGVEMVAWGDEFSRGVDVDLLTGWLLELGSDSYPGQICELLDRFAELAPDVATAAFTANFEQLKAGLEHDLADTAQQLFHWAFGSMLLVALMSAAPGTFDDEFDQDEDGIQGVQDPAADDSAETQGCGNTAVGQQLTDQRRLDEEGARLWKATESQRRILSATVLEAMETVDWEMAGRSIVGKELHEFQSFDLLICWLGTLSADLLDQMLSAVPDDYLEALTADHWEDPAPIAVFLGAVSSGANRVRIENLIDRHEAEIEKFPFRLIERFPSIAARLAVAGKQVHLDPVAGSSWHRNARVLHEINSVSSDAARRILAGSLEQLREPTQKPQAYGLAGFAHFVEAADGIDAAVLNTVIAALDPTVAGEAWGERVKDSPGAMAALLQRAAAVDGEIGELARRMRRET